MFSFIFPFHQKVYGGISGKIWLFLRLGNVCFAESKTRLICRVGEETERGIEGRGGRGGKACCMTSMETSRLSAQPLTGWAERAKMMSGWTRISFKV